MVEHIAHREKHMEEHPEIMTLEEVAGYLRVSERTVSEWVARGDIPGGKLGTSWRFKRPEIERWVTRKLTPRIEAEPEDLAGLSSALAPECVVRLAAATKKDALDELIELCSTRRKTISRDELARAIFDREKLLSTGIGLSIAVPHARLNSVTSLCVAVGVSETGITDYESLDDQPVRIIVMIVAGRDQHAGYIQMLARVAKILKDPRVKEKILQAHSQRDIYDTLTGKDREHQ